MIFQERSEVIKKILDEAEKTFNEGILSESELREIRETIEKNSLNIGICGQVKTGKSTFINSYIFGKNILPVASTPMTASLCYITFSETPLVEVEFFSNQEWSEIEELAKNQGIKEGFDKSEQIKAAKEYIKQSEKIQSEIPHLLSTKKIISFEELKNYVGSEGRYTPIVKALKITLPDENLKNIVIVDTPGTNDPVSSRERRTLDFLKEADVVFLFCYSGRPFDSSDRELLRRLKNCVGKVIIVINKKDIILAEEGNEEKILNRFREQINELIKEIRKENGNPFIIEMLEKARQNIVIFSSLWALLGRLSIEEIRNNRDLQYYFDKFTEDFPNLKEPQDLYNHSGIKEMDIILKEIIKEKDKVLIVKPINTLIQSFDKKISDLKKERDSYDLERESYKHNLDEIKKEMKKIEKLENDISEILHDMIISLRKDIDKVINDKTFESRRKLENSYQAMRTKIPEKGFFTTHGTYQRKCEEIFDQELYKIKSDLEALLLNLGQEFRDKIDFFLRELFNEIKDKGDDLYITKKDYRNLIENAFNNLGLELNDIKAFIRSQSFKTEGWWFTKSDIARDSILTQVNEVLLGTNGLHVKVQDNINKYYQRVLGYVNKIETTIIDKVLNKIYESLERSKENYNNKEKRINDLDKFIEDLDKKIKELAEKYDRINKEFSVLKNNR